MSHPHSQLIGQGESCDPTEGRGVQEMHYCPASGKQRAGKCGRGSRWGPQVCRPSASIVGSCTGLQAESLSRVRPFVTLRTVRSPPGSSVRGILQSRTLEWVAMPSSRGPSQPRGQTSISHVSALAGRFLSSSAAVQSNLGRRRQVVQCPGRTRGSLALGF